MKKPLNKKKRNLIILFFFFFVICIGIVTGIVFLSVQAEKEGTHVDWGFLILVCYVFIVCFIVPAIGMLAAIFLPLIHGIKTKNQTIIGIYIIILILIFLITVAVLTGILPLEALRALVQLITFGNCG